MKKIICFVSWWFYILLCYLSRPFILSLKTKNYGVQINMLLTWYYTISRIMLYGFNNVPIKFLKFHLSLYFYEFIYEFRSTQTLNFLSIPLCYQLMP